MMLSRLGTSIARQSQALLRQRAVLCPAQKMGYLKDLGLDSEAIALRESGETKQADVQLWKEQAESTQNALVLKTDDEIEQYVLSITKDYFLTTRKAAVSLDSAFADHGLDSLDVIELVIRVEDELGLMIDAENLQKFKKPRHFVNFIKQMEAYKEEFNRLPQEDTKYEFSFKKAFPGIPFVTN